jgi:hypothetical protein
MQVLSSIQGFQRMAVDNETGKILCMVVVIRHELLLLVVVVVCR